MGPGNNARMVFLSRCDIELRDRGEGSDFSFYKAIFASGEEMRIRNAGG